MGVSDGILSLFGLTMYLGGRIFLAVVPSQMAVFARTPSLGFPTEGGLFKGRPFAVIAFDSFVRFPQSGIRSILSAHAGPHEQGTGTHFIRSDGDGCGGL